MSIASVTSTGRKVRCTKCFHIWTQYPSKDKQKKKEATVKKVSLSRSLPVVIEYVVPGWLKLLPAIFAVLILVTSVFFFHEDIENKYQPLRSVYTKVGILNSGNIEIQKTELLRKDNNSIDINGFVVNNSEERRRVPNIVVRVVDQTNKKILSFVIKAPKSDLSNGGKYAFFKNIKNIPSSAKLITLEIEDKMDKLYG
jgi:hypothetical protein